MKGVKRVKPRGSDPRLPITPFILQKIYSIVIQDAQSPLNIMMWAACCLGYFAFLRAGKFTLQSNGQYNPEIHLSPADISVDSHQEPSLMRIRLKQSKTDQQRVGVDLYVGRTFNNLCPVAAMLAYLVIRGQTDGPLFSVNGRCLTRDMLVQWLRSTLAKAGHTFPAIRSELEQPVLLQRKEWENRQYKLLVDGQAIHTRDISVSHERNWPSFQKRWPANFV